MKENSLDIVTIQKTVDMILSEHRLKGWVLDGVRFDYLTNSYMLLFSQKDQTIKIKVLKELIIDACTSEDSFKRRKLKTLLKGMLGEKNS